MKFAIAQSPTVRRIATFALLPLLAPTLRADDWPQWRGPNRDGVCHESGLLQSFPAAGLKVRWRVPAGWDGGFADVY